MQKATIAHNFHVSKDLQYQSTSVLYPEICSLIGYTTIYSVLVSEQRSSGHLLMNLQLPFSFFEVSVKRI